MCDVLKNRLSACFAFSLKIYLTSIQPLYLMYIKLASVSSVILYCVQSFIFSFEKVLLKPYGFSGILFAAKTVRSTI